MGSFQRHRHQEILTNMKLVSLFLLAGSYTAWAADIPDDIKPQRGFSDGLKAVLEKPENQAKFKARMDGKPGNKDFTEAMKAAKDGERKMPKFMIFLEEKLMGDKTVDLAACKEKYNKKSEVTVDAAADLAEAVNDESFYRANNLKGEKSFKRHIDGLKDCVDDTDDLTDAEKTELKGEIMEMEDEVKKRVDKKKMPDGFDWTPRNEMLKGTGPDALDMTDAEKKDFFTGYKLKRADKCMEDLPASRRRRSLRRARQSGPKRPSREDVEGFLGKELGDRIKDKADIHKEGKRAGRDMAMGKGADFDKIKKGRDQLFSFMEYTPEQITEMKAKYATSDKCLEDAVSEIRTQQVAYETEGATAASSMTGFGVALALACAGYQFV